MKRARGWLTQYLTPVDTDEYGSRQEYLLRIIILATAAAIPVGLLLNFTEYELTWDPATRQMLGEVNWYFLGLAAVLGICLGLLQRARTGPAVGLLIACIWLSAGVLDIMLGWLPLVFLVYAALVLLTQTFVGGRGAFAAVAASMVSFGLTQVIKASGIVPAPPVKLPIFSQFIGEFIVLTLIAVMTWIISRVIYRLLRRSLDEKEMMLAQLHDREFELTTLNEELAKATQAKSEFLASMSHELRTPMNAILGFTEAVLAGVDGPVSAEQKESLGWVQRSGRELLALIDDILDLSRIEAGKVMIKPETLVPAALIEAVWGQHRRLAQDKGLTFVWHDEGAPREVTLDSQRTSQILRNLVGNAIKFTESGEVRIVARKDAGEKLEVAVHDTGPGIELEDQEAIFEDFRQAENTSRKSEGTGLGLAISRRLARMMGGDVTVSSVSGGGSVFTLTLPPDCTSIAASGRPADWARPVERVILAIDDGRSLPRLMETMLAGTRYRVIGADNLVEAIRIARALRPDVITLDLLTSRRAEGQVLRDLREDSRARQTPVVLVTDLEQGVAAKDPGAAYLTKPITKASLLATLEGLEQPITARRN
jgi:signal transduction histidine kinase/CheY-like chemotaxis protein